MSKSKNPVWWSTEDDSAWERIKAAVQRDWDQTKHDLGGAVPDTGQDVTDTVAQAAGKQPVPPRGAPTVEEIESAYRFGHGARRHYGGEYVVWTDALEAKLHADWSTMYPGQNFAWPLFRFAVRRGWNLAEEEQGGRRR